MQIIYGFEEADLDFLSQGELGSQGLSAEEILEDLETKLEQGEITLTEVLQLLTDHSVRNTNKLNTNH
jgi:hypothetical protein